MVEDRSNRNGNAGALPAAYGGEGWQVRLATTREEMGGLWGDFGVASEWGRLRAVLLHAPGAELSGIADPQATQMLAPVNAGLLRVQHEALAEVYRAAGVAVHQLSPEGAVPPNTLFMADLLFMTAEGAIVARPASTVRAGEERLAAHRLAELGVPILRTVHGTATFEGADALWLDGSSAMVATGLRTNEAGARQVSAVLRDLGAEVVPVHLPRGAMHLMGSLRLIAPRLAAAWPAGLPHKALRTLEERDFRVLFLPDEAEWRRMALNFVVLGEKQVLMAAGCPRTQGLLEEAGVRCRTVEIGEITKAAGGMGCLTAILKRDPQEGDCPVADSGNGPDNRGERP